MAFRLIHLMVGFLLTFVMCVMQILVSEELSGSAAGNDATAADTLDTTSKVSVDTI